MLEKIKELIEKSNQKLSIKQISELTGIPRSTVKRYCSKLEYKPIRHQIWNKGLTKENNSSLKKLSSKLIGIKRNKLSKETKIKISNTMKLNPLSGGFRLGSGRGNKHIYNNIILNTDYSLMVAKALDAEQIKWQQPNKILDYNFEFYLPEYGLYLVTKETVTNDLRSKFLELKKQNIKFIIIDYFCYKRIKYLGIKYIILNYKS